MGVDTTVRAWIYATYSDDYVEEKHLTQQQDELQLNPIARDFQRSKVKLDKQLGSDDSVVKYSITIRHTVAFHKVSFVNAQGFLQHFERLLDMAKSASHPPTLHFEIFGPRQQVEFIQSALGP